MTPREIPDSPSNLENGTPVMNKILATSLTLMLVLQQSAAGIAGSEWPAFRGENGTGLSTAKDVPTEWSADSNVAWKTAVEGNCNGSPVVSAGHVFVTSADKEGKERRLHCLDAASGKQLWVQTVSFDKVLPTHETNLYAGTTPAADGKRVVVWHASAGLYCYDFAGKELWNRQLGEFRHLWGYGTSPVIHDGKVILHTGPGKSVFIIALNPENGETLWKFDEPVEGDGEHNAEKKYMGSWSTPVIVELNGKQTVVCSMSTRVVGLDPKSGKLQWSCEGLRGDRGDLCYTSPVIAGDICVAMGGYQGPAIGFRMQGEGDITATGTLWRKTEGNPQRIGSAVVVDGLLYQVNAGPNTIQCIDPATGELKWQARSPGGAAFWSSIVVADGLLYSTDQKGGTLVFRPNAEKLERVAMNKLDEPTNSTPAIVDGQVFIRTFGNVYCIRKP